MYRTSSRIFLILLLIASSINAFSQWGDFFTTNLQEEEYSQQEQVRDGEDVSFLNGLSFRPYTGLGYVFEDPVGIIGLKANIPIIKSKLFLGLRLPAYFTFNNQQTNSIIAEHKYNELVDYFDIIDYFQYGSREKEWFARLSNIENTTLGSGVIMNDYDMRIHSLTYDQLGLEVQYKHQDNEVYLMVSDIKKFLQPVPSSLVALHFSGSPLSKFNFSFTAAADFNEYNSLWDFDQDNVPDIMDLFPTDKTLATGFDRWALADKTPPWTNEDTYIKELGTRGFYPQHHVIYEDESIKKPRREYSNEIILAADQRAYNNFYETTLDTLFNLNSLYPFLGKANQRVLTRAKDSSAYVDLAKDRKMVIVIGTEASYNFIEQTSQTFGAYIHGSSIIGTNGIGTGLGVSFNNRNNFGEFINAKFEGRFSTPKFLFSYFDHTYETTKARLSPAVPFTEGANTRKRGLNYLYTRSELLERIDQMMVGGHLDFKINFYNYVALRLVGSMMIGIGTDIYPKGEQPKDEDPQTILVNTGAVNNGLSVTSFGFDLELGKLVSPVIHSGRIFLKQNNYISRKGDFLLDEDSFFMFARPETVFGAEFVFTKTNAGSLHLNFETPFIDKNGNGTIDGWHESFKNISLTGIIKL